MLSRHFMQHRDEFVTPFNRLFDEMMKSNFPEFSKEFGVDFFSKASYPKMNVAVVDAGVEVTAEIPGLTKDDVKIKFFENVLTISGDKKFEPETTPERIYVIKELKHSTFKRSLKFTQEVDANKIAAKFDNGILLVFVPWKEPKKPEQIEFDITID